jgi:integral membrane protein
VESALKRFRVAAYVVGVFLLILTLVAMPMKYLGDDKTLIAIVGPIHGFLYMVYLVVAFHLAALARWPFKYTLGVLIAGTIPFLSFVAERKVTHRVRAAQTAAGAEPVRSSSAAR